LTFGTIAIKKNDRILKNTNFSRATGGFLSMKIIISGKGGSGKSTISTLIARSLAAHGFNVLLVDADESNFGLQRLLGVDAPVHLMDDFGGKAHFKKNWMGTASEGLFKDHTRISDLPQTCIAQSGDVKLLIIGKVHSHGEGCACPMGVLSKSILAKLDVMENEVVVVDAEAGVEHFGRRVDGECDLVLGVVDPSFESFMLAKKMESMAYAAGCEIFFILNKATPDVLTDMKSHIPADKIIAVIPHNNAVFMDSLKGNRLEKDLPEIDPVCKLIKDRRNRPANRANLFSVKPGK
jgi:CO dehydrogenase maturation factor